MKRILTTGAAVLLAQSALAGGLDRSGQGTSIIFEDGRYAEFSLGLINPDVTGTAVGQDSGNVAQNYSQIEAAYKWSYSGSPWDAAVIYDQPFGADTDYAASTTYPLRGSTASFTSNALTVLGKYQLDGGVSIYGGLKAQTIEMSVALPGFPGGGYTAEGSREQGFGYVVGAAYERPEIALRAALTYHSAIDYSVKTTENGATSPDTDVTTPQSVNLDFQTGIAADTLLFGSARWVNWKAFDISPTNYTAATSEALVSYANNTINYSIGIGRQFSAQWSGAVTLGYEPSGGGFQSDLGPTDGQTSFGVGGTYTSGNMKVTGGVQYVLPGDAQTQISPTGPVISDFKDNSAIAIGLKVGFAL